MSDLNWAPRPPRLGDPELPNGFFVFNSFAYRVIKPFSCSFYGQPVSYGSSELARNTWRFIEGDVVQIVVVKNAVVSFTPDQRPNPILTLHKSIFQNHVATV